MTRSSGYRPMPRDFEALFVEHGWEARDVLEVSTPMFRRWLDESGYDRMKLLRREHVESLYAREGKRVGGRRPRSAAGRYVMGKRRTIVWKKRAPKFWDVELLTAERVERPSVRAQMMAGAAPIDFDQPMLPLDEINGIQNG